MSVEKVTGVLFFGCWALEKKIDLECLVVEHSEPKKKKNEYSLHGEINLNYYFHFQQKLKQK